ncbi:hypothetical protein SAMN04487916_111102 [Arthrobacter sp. ov407]|nr:hypothetical protein SAMN04487916_111102 [Arthrobacter sp. ov407]
MNPMASLDTPEVSGDVLLLIAGIGVAAIILMAAFLTFLYYRDRAEDKRSKKKATSRHRREQ